MQYKNIFYIIALTVHLPMILRYSNFMMNKGHYSFFPLLVGAVAWLAYRRLQSLNPEKKVHAGAWPTIWLVLDAFFLIISSLLFRAEFFMPSLMCLAAAYVSDRYGKIGFRAALPPCLLLLLIIPPLYKLDEKLIIWLQFWSSLTASTFLDTFGQIHFREGVVLITEKKQFFAEEACSGIRSLFSSLAGNRDFLRDESIPSLAICL